MIHPHVLMAAGQATQHAANILSRRLDHHHARALSELKRGVVEMLAAKVTERQLTFIHSQATFILNEFAKDADLYRGELREIGAALRNTDDAFKTATLRSRSSELDAQLKTIREACHLLHASTSALLLEAGNQLISFSGDINIAIPSQLSGGGNADIVDI